MIPLPSEPIEVVIARFHGPPQPRRGERSDRPWWICPFHDDQNPSLCVIPGSDRFYCFGCGSHGDAINFVRQLNPSMTFREALQAIGDGSFQSPSYAIEARILRPATHQKPTKRPDGWQDFAQGVVDQTGSMLWSDQGDKARAYLQRRGLNEGTIRTARLGFQPRDEWIEGVFDDGKAWIPRGIVIPWFDGPKVELISVRRPEGDPKYIAIRGSNRSGIYPGRAEIVSRKPVVIAEGEFDALLLKQELVGLASVVTLGSASSKPNARIMNALLGAFPWIVSVDVDDTGEKSAEEWLARFDRAVRVAPPAEHGKDWTDAFQNGLDLREWWIDVLGRIAPSPRPVPGANTSQSGRLTVTGRDDGAA